MAEIFAITNQKGGVGKTTTAINLAASLAATRKKVLLIDSDPQGNATMGSGINKSSLKRSMHGVLTQEYLMSDAILECLNAGYSLLPANSDLTAAEVFLMCAEKREFRLKHAIAAVKTDYDYILIDCPPALNMLTINAFTAAHGVIIPMQCEYYALEGLSALVETIEQIRIDANPGLRIEGLLRTMYDTRNKLARDVSKQLVRFFGEKVYRTIIPRNVRLAEAPSYGLPVFHYDRASKGAVSYLALAGEILRKQDFQAA